MKAMSFPSRQEAVRAWQHLLKVLPVAPDAYAASGRLPLAALALLLAGVPLGALASAIAGTVVLLLTLAVAWPFAWLTGVVMDWWVIPKILPLAVAAIYAAGVIAVGASLGFAASMVIAALGRKGHNRSPATAATLAACAAVLGTGLFAAAVLRFSGSRDEAALMFGGVALAIAGLIALVAAFAGAADSVRTARYCETCHRYLETRDLGSLPLDSATMLRDALLARRLDAVSQVLQQPGDGLQLSLDTCGSCGRAVLDGKVTGEARFPEAGKERRDRRTWRFLSTWLEAADARVVAQVRTDRFGA